VATEKSSPMTMGLTVAAFRTGTSIDPSTYSTVYATVTVSSASTSSPPCSMQPPKVSVTATCALGKAILVMGWLVSPMSCEKVVTSDFGT
jgi:hypothetical protein